jgi:hypothetical protein
MDQLEMSSLKRFTDRQSMLLVDPDSAAAPHPSGGQRSRRTVLLRNAHIDEFIVIAGEVASQLGRSPAAPSPGLSCKGDYDTPKSACCIG